MRFARFSSAGAFAGLILLSALGLSQDVSAQRHMVGPQKCAECHEAETKVWEGSKHAKSFNEVHRKPEVKDILAAVGRGTNMRRNEVCASCHFSNVQASATAAPTASAGPSCESCHGKASEWIQIHSDYGGPQAKRESESPARKAERIRKAAAAGMIWPSNVYDVAENCLSCHFMGRPDVPADTIAKMIGAGHPAGSQFELVRYSQGTVRHRFYPPDITKNAQMTPAELSRLFLTGHAAALVQSSGPLGKSSNAKLQKTLDDTRSAARAALEAVRAQVPEAGTLLARPTAENARLFVAAIATRDLSAAVGSRLPAPSSYK
jgi:hypothetical protein